MAWEGRGRASIREPGDRLRHRSTDLTRDEDTDEPIPGVTIWFLSHAETDLLALRSTIEDLPAGLGPVRVANPAGGPPVRDGGGSGQPGAAPGFRRRPDAAGGVRVRAAPSAARHGRVGRRGS